MKALIAAISVALILAGAATADVIPGGGPGLIERIVALESSDNQQNKDVGYLFSRAASAYEMDAIHDSEIAGLQLRVKRLERKLRIQSGPRPDSSPRKATS